MNNDQVKPSLYLLFSLLTTRQKLVILLPAILSSLVAGGIAPFMTLVLGDSFNAFAKFPLQNPSSDDKSRLLHDVGIAALQLVGLAVGSLALSAITSSLWIWTGELNVREARRRVFSSVISQDLSWFHSTDVGAAGLMAQFTSDTDTLRLATSLASGLLIQHLTTTLTALILAFTKSPLLTLLTLASVPLILVIQAISQIFAAPLISRERGFVASLATLVERSLTLLPTLKAFNATPSTLRSLGSVLSSLHNNDKSLNTIFSIQSGFSQFLMMSMFVQSFWFGSTLVRKGSIQPGTVMSVFWACLIATSNLQMCVPQLIAVGKGKIAISELVRIVRQNEEESKRGSRRLKKILPSAPMKGEFSLSNVYFSYPSRPTHRVLDNVDMFIPSGEMTFIVGGSGSGKSSVAGLLSGLWRLDGPAGKVEEGVRDSFDSERDVEQGIESKKEPRLRNTGSITVDNQEMRFLDDNWVRENVGVVDQTSTLIISNHSIHYNVAIALCAPTAPSSPSLPSTSQTPDQVTRAEVVDACRAALMHEFIRDLPDGYDTILVDDEGADDAEDAMEKPTGGVRLSGGQKQRLAIARARLRNPRVLILDEPTSALDPPSRQLVLAAMRNWRKGKTTVVVSHDLGSPDSESTSSVPGGTILPKDFVYVMKDGRVVENGFRCDLDRAGGEFKRLVEMGSAPVDDASDFSDDESDFGSEDFEDKRSSTSSRRRTLLAKHASYSVRNPVLSRLSFAPETAGWMFDVVADLTRGTEQSDNKRMSIFPPPQKLEPLPPLPPLHIPSTSGNRLGRPSSVSDFCPPSPRSPYHYDSSSTMTLASTPLTPASADTLTLNNIPKRRLSLQFTPTSPTFPKYPPQPPQARVEDDEDFDQEKGVLERSGQVAKTRTKRRQQNSSAIELEIVVSSPGESQIQEKALPNTIYGLVPHVLPYVPHKFLLFAGLLLCLASGALTPVFSFLLSKLLFQVSTINQVPDTSSLNRLAGLVLGISAIDGVVMGLKYAVMEGVGMSYVRECRRRGMEKLVGMDKGWWDGARTVDNGSAPQMKAPAASQASPTATADKATTGNSISAHADSVIHFTQTLVTQGEDTKSLLSICLGQALVVISMLGVGLIWAMAIGWQFTLVGLAIAPVFAGVMVIQSGLVARCERRNRVVRREVGKGYFDLVNNIRTIRSLHLSPFFHTRFHSLTDHALSVGVKGALVEGCTFGVASGLIYLAEALLFYVGAVFIAKGMYTYLQMVQVLNLVVFSVTIGSQLMAFTNRITRAIQATQDMLQVLQLDTLNTSESKGALRPTITSSPVAPPSPSPFSLPPTTISSSVTFSSVSFSYPTRPDVPVLSSCDLSIYPGECVAVVGPSGCGKSTIASLLQRLYEPKSGSILLGGPTGVDIGMMDVSWLRKHLTVVSQTPTLFDMTIAENIAYGLEGGVEAHYHDIRRAAKLANVHEWIMSLPEGYETPIGEKASGISGGQAQRLMIARALARKDARVMVLDECTSALDAENQRKVVETLVGLKEGGVGEERQKMTMVMITHKVPVMRMCDRILVLGEGRVVEEGTYDELMKQRGVFAGLASGGEWQGE